ncbi:MAG: stage II sporulation protein P [Acutalibacteraceae bacterium]|nr:stage II sporulation protein P [Acutalibacteraceae bacterium]
MKNINHNRIINVFATTLAGAISVFATFCTISRLNEINSELSIQMLASSLSMPQSVVANTVNETEIKYEAVVATQAPTTPVNTATEKTTEKSKEITDDESKYTGTKYPVIEQQFGSSGEGYDNFSVKNSTDYNIDYEQLLSNDLGFDITNTDKPQVLIVHTHTTESFLINDNGYYYTDYPFRNEDSSRNMVAVGNEIVKSLKNNGITAIQATEIHDRTYTGSYSRSEETIYKYIEKYPDIRVILDIHRDAVGYNDERGKYKPTFTYNGKKAAQIMIMSGYDPYNSYGLGHWQENLTFALKLQQKAEQLYPGMTRPLYFGDFAYNMFINNGSLLIEVGTETNTLSEAKYTGELLGNVVAQVLNDNKRNN